MAENNITVDELAIEVVAEATTAATSIDVLTGSLERLQTILAPTLNKLAALSTTLGRLKTVGLKTANRVADATAGAGIGAVGGTGGAAAAAASAARLTELNAAFQEVKAGMAAGLIPANTALAQMGSIASRTNTELVKLKVAADGSVDPTKIAAGDAAFSAMKTDVVQLAASLKVVPPVIEHATVASMRFRMSLGAFQNLTSKQNFNPVSPTALEQLRNAGKQLTDMRSKLAAVSREQGPAFNPALVARYTTAVSAAQNRLDKLTAAARRQQTLSQFSTVTAMGPTLPGAFPTAPLTAAGAAAQVATTKMNTGLKLSGGVLSGVRTKLAGFTQQLQGLGKVGPQAVNTLGGSFIQLRSTIFFAFFALGAIVGLFKVFVGAAVSLIERMNLFSVAFGDLRKEANAYADTITNTLGIDPVKFKETYSTFFLMSSSLGMVDKSAQKVSQTFTQLTYDYASLMEMDFSVVEGKFRSAMAGQTRAIAAFGLDVTLASLQEEAFREGIKTSVKEMTKANKIILMHNLIVRNSAQVQGDLARTLSSPANMMRVLKDQFVVASRSIGYLFIPMLQAVLPWLIALAQGINIAAQSFLGLFGIKMPSWKTMTEGISGAAGGTDDLFGGMEDVSDATGKAADNAKKLKDYVLGIDELNILAPEVPTSTGGTGGTGGVGTPGGPAIEPFDVYDMLGGIEGLTKMLEPVKAAFAVVKKALDPFIKALGRLWDALKPFIKNVWTGFTEFYRDVLIPLAVWTMNTVGVWVLDQIRAILEWFNAHPGAAKALGAALATFSALKGLDVLISVVSRFGTIIGSVFGIKFLGVLAANIATFMSLFTAGDITTKIGLFFASLGSGSGVLGALSAALGISVGWILLIVAAIVAATVLIISNWDHIKAAAGWLWDKIKELWGGIVTAWEAIKEKTSGVWKFIGAVLKTTWETIKVLVMVPLALIWAAILIAWDAIKTATKAAWDWVYSKIEGPLKAIWKFIEPTFKAIKKIAGETWEGLKAGLSAAWETIKSVFKGGANFIIRMINKGPIKLLNTILNAARKLPGAAQLLKGVGNITEIPLLAAGGSVPEGSLYRAGEAGPEIIGSYAGNPNTVLPLENSGFIEAMHKAVYGAVASAMSAVEIGGNGDIYMDGQRVGEIIRKGENRSGVATSLVKAGAS